MKMRSTRTAAVALLLLSLCACRETPLVPDANQDPIADAQFINPAGMSVDEIVAKDDPAALQIPFNGAPVAVTLNGGASKDDGKIVKYQWLSGDKGPMDRGRGGVDPADVEQPVVMLGMGTFKFVLWVTDDDGVVSEPDSVSVTVGGGSGADDPAVLECAANVFDMVTDPCKKCICLSADCRPKVIESACDESCWELIQCIATMCPNYANGDTACVGTMCSAFLGGITGAMGAGSCVVPCADMCSPGMPGAAGDAGM
jgi:hypothetical protein